MLKRKSGKTRRRLIKRGMSEKWPNIREELMHQLDRSARPTKDRLHRQRRHARIPNLRRKKMRKKVRVALMKIRMERMMMKQRKIQRSDQK